MLTHAGRVFSFLTLTDPVTLTSDLLGSVTQVDHASCTPNLLTLASFVFDLTDGMSRQTERQTDKRRQTLHVDYYTRCAIHLARVIIFPLIPSH